MFRVINEYMEKIKLQSDDDIKAKFDSFLKDDEAVKTYSIMVNFNRYVLDIKIKNYSVEKAARFFSRFDSEISYPYSSLHVRFNEGKCVRYRFMTCKENKDGIYCDIVIG